MKHLHKIVKKEKTLSVPLEIPVPLKEKRDSGAGKDGKVIRGLEDAFNRVELLLSPYQMILENYPLPAHSGINQVDIPFSAYDFFFVYRKF